jgi:hypothetical protein
LKLKERRILKKRGMLREINLFDNSSQKLEAQE